MVRVLKGTLSTPSIWRVSRETPRFRLATQETRQRSVPTEKFPGPRLSHEYINAPDFRNVDFELFDDFFTSEDEDESDAFIEEDGTITVPQKRGRRKGVPLDEANRLSIQAAMKGKNKYKRTALHRARVGRSLKRVWQQRKESGWKPAPRRCSICGELGHTKRSCPTLPETEKKRQQNQRTAKHRRKISGGSKKGEGEQTTKTKNASKRKQTTQHLRRSTLCGEVGYNRRTCPNHSLDPADQDKKTSAVERSSNRRKRNSQSSASSNSRSLDEAIESVKESDIEDLESLYTVPVKVEHMWKMALECAVRAYRSGISRQCMKFTFPELCDGVTIDPAMSLTGDTVRKFRVASLIVEAILKGMKSEWSLKGDLNIGILDDDEGTVYWEGKEISAMLFPQPQTLDIMISRAMMQRREAPRLQLLVNPQWKPGQIVSDFGFGQLKTMRQDYAASFDEVFYMKQLSIFGDTVIVMRCYPSQWQVHLVEPSGDIVLIGTTGEKPDFEEVLNILRKSDDALSRLNWVERFKTKYIDRQRRFSPFPLSVTKAELEQCFDQVDLSVAERLSALNNDGKSMRAYHEDFMPAFDIVTGEVVRDIKMDPR